MPNVFAVKTGNWNDPTVWNTGALPTTADDVFSNGFVVTLTGEVTVLSLRNTAVAGINQGGQFTMGTTLRSVAANIQASTISALVVSNLATGTATFSGNFNGGSALGAFGISIGNCSNLNISFVCNSVGGSAQATNGVSINSNNCIINYTGTMQGGLQSQSDGLHISGTTNTIAINGHCIGGTGGGGEF